jgi:hypothetical protein
MAGCSSNSTSSGNNNSDKNESGITGLKSGNPTNAELSSVGLTQANLNTMMSAASRSVDPNYLGYVFNPDWDGMAVLTFFWKNKNRTNFYNMITDVAAMLNISFYNYENDNYENDFALSVEESYDNGESGVVIGLAKRDFHEEDFDFLESTFFPKDTLLAIFLKDL